MAGAECAPSFRCHALMDSSLSFLGTTRAIKRDNGSKPVYRPSRLTTLRQSLTRRLGRLARSRFSSCFNSHGERPLRPEPGAAENRTVTRSASTRYPRELDRFLDMSVLGGHDPFIILLGESH